MKDQKLQIERFGESIDVTITEWNTGGLLTRIEVRVFRISIADINEISEITALIFRDCVRSFLKRS